MNVTLDYFDKFLISGDYVCVEEAAPHCATDSGMGLPQHMG